ncbi:LptA/OstA family protein [Anianabacter salinae]|uniref:LptA/OstA family protein n=1 Tax=Anianabacter salinae TaxID=2851023 RepID=UPI00225E6337|nr:LptA/OstA family protein [Anianabacter salinae]MBV0913584.1 lipopolysaccharide transport periplasmic protein LptA [Anianabacter salinae]
MRAACLALLIALLPVAAAAQGAAVDLGQHDSSQPIEVTSDELRLDRSRNTAMFEGNVVATQGALTLTSRQLEVDYGAEGTGGSSIRMVTAIGDVVMVNGEDVAQSRRAVYTVGDSLIVMTEDVIVIQGETVLTSDQLTYDLASGEGLMEGRVTTLLVPEEE